MAGVVVVALVGISDVGDPDVAGRVGGEVSGVEDPGGEEVSGAGVGGPGGEGEVVAGTSVEVASTGRPASFEIIFSASMGWISRRWISLWPVLLLLPALLLLPVFLLLPVLLLPLAGTGRPASCEIIFSASMGWISRRWMSLLVLWFSSVVGCVFTSLSMMFDSPVSSACRDCIIPVMSRSQRA